MKFDQLDRAMALEEDRPLQVRALNRDNAQEGLQVAQLLEDTYGNAYPYHDWYHPNAWFAEDAVEREPEQVTGMLVVENDDIVGHLAYRIPHSLGGVELLLPAIDQRQEEISAEVEELFWSKLHMQAQRQGWQFAFLCVPLKNLTRCFESHALSRGVPTAIIPARQTRDALVVISFELNRPPQRLSRSYVHPNLKRLVEHVYNCFRIDRDVIPSMYRVAMRCDDQYPTPIHGRHGTRRFQWHFDTVEGLGFMPPLEIAERSRQFAERVNRCGRTLVLSLPVSSPRYAAMCGALLSNEFQACGLVPGCNGGDRVLLCHVERDRLNSLRVRAPSLAKLKSTLY